MPSVRLLIVGYGNRLRGDDAAGYLAAERLRQFVSPEVEVLAVHQLTPELAEPISRADHVIFIDATAAGTPGEILKRCVTPLPAAGGFTHHSTPEGLLAAAAALYSHAPEATLYSIPAQSFELSEQLSPPVQDALNRLVQALRRQ
jgi:hydrogenase maturation protease